MLIFTWYDLCALFLYLMQYSMLMMWRRAHNLRARVWLPAMRFLHKVHITRCSRYTEYISRCFSSIMISMRSSHAHAYISQTIWNVSTQFNCDWIFAWTYTPTDGRTAGFAASPVAAESHIHCRRRWSLQCRCPLGNMYMCYRLAAACCCAVHPRITRHRWEYSKFALVR